MTVVLILGVRGQTGRQVAAQLSEHADVSVIGTSRDIEGIDLPGVKPLIFDWQDPDTWPLVFEAGADAVYLVRPEIEDAPERIAAFLGEARGFKHIVLLSELGTDQLSETDWSARVEQAVTESLSTATIVRPGPFMQLLTDERFTLPSIRDDSQLPVPTGGAGSAYVDVRDVADVVVAGLLDEGTLGQAYSITGPESLKAADVAQRLSRVLGRTIEQVGGSVEDTIKEWEGGDMDPWLLEYLREALTRSAEGALDFTTDDVERVTGHPARSLEAFIEEHAQLWQPGATAGAQDESSTV